MHRYGAVTSNVAFASRAVLSKATMDKPVGENMGAANLYGMLTIIAFILSFPFALYYEGPGFMAAWKASTAVVGAPWLIRQMTLDGFYYYAYNEVSDRTLSPEAVARLLRQAPLRTCWSPRARPPRCNLLYCHGHGRRRCRGSLCSPLHPTSHSNSPSPLPLSLAQVAFITLNQVAPVTHSIANTFKRVAIILATVLVFGNKLTTLGAIGSAIAVAGTLLYSLAKQKYK